MDIYFLGLQFNSEAISIIMTLIMLIIFMSKWCHQHDQCCVVLMWLGEMNRKQNRKCSLTCLISLNICIYINMIWNISVDVWFINIKLWIKNLFWCNNILKTFSHISINYNWGVQPHVVWVLNGYCSLPWASDDHLKWPLDQPLCWYIDHGI